MKLGFKMAALAAAASAGILSAAGGAQAQSGYDYTLWPFITAWPIQAPVQAPLHSQVKTVRDNSSHWIREAGIERPVSFTGCSACQTFIIGVGY